MAKNKIRKGVILNIIVGIVIVIVAGIFFYSRQNSKGDTESNDEIYASLSPQAQQLYFKQSDSLTKPVSQRLIELDQLTIGCFGADTVMQMSSSEPNLGGQCCGVLKDINAYEIQLQALHDFIKEVEIEELEELIPSDPYDIPVAEAQKLIAFDTEIVLSAEQQKIYDEAIQLSHHGGPCCCKCWKWYAMSGLGKKLIVDYGFTAEQLAELWDLSSSCGHDEDTNFAQHYKHEAIA